MEGEHFTAKALTNGADAKLRLVSLFSGGKRASDQLGQGRNAAGEIPTDLRICRKCGKAGQQTRVGGAGAGGPEFLLRERIRS